MRLREAATEALDAPTLDAIRSLMDEAFDGFTGDDFEHALGGRHWLLEDDAGRLVSHASVVERSIEVGERTLRAGYLEAVATAPGAQRRGHGTTVVRAATAWLRDRFKLGALSTGEHPFYERLGWERWRGSSLVRDADGTLERTPDEDDGILILRTPSSPPIDLADRIVAPRRPGDSW